MGRHIKAQGSIYVGLRVGICGGWGRYEGTGLFLLVTCLYSPCLKGLKSRDGGWFLGERTEGTGEFSREFGGLKAGKSEFKGRKVLNFHENLRGGLGQTSKNQYES